jgi:histidinol dehydrogenase
MRIVSTKDRGFPAALKKLLTRGETGEQAVEKKVQTILEEVRRKGDRALIAYTRQWDGVVLTPSTLRVSPEAVQGAYRALRKDEIRALRYAARNISLFHRRQRVRSWSFRKNGSRLGQRVLPIETVGIYVPGGRAVYPSSVLMNAIPAKVAGVPRVVMCTPIPGGHINPYLLVAADISGIEEIYTVGGAQAIGAMAFGTETIPRVDKIVGPGNIFVATAKKRVFGHVGIDLFAGPSEIVILADDSAVPAYVAADLLSQAEHDEMAVAVLITPSDSLSEQVLREIRVQQKDLPRGPLIRKSLNTHGFILRTSDMEEAISLSNQIAPEHLSLQIVRPEKQLAKITHAGAIFLGHLTPQTLGDYVAGPSHVLPTGGTARFSSPLTVEDFVKRSSVLTYSRRALEKEGPIAIGLARAEGLWAHARAVEIRIRKKTGENHVP